MTDALEQALNKAREALSGLLPAPIEKTIWGSPAGKKKLAKRLVALLPPHETYVEPFAGSAAVLFEKEPSKVEVINDADAEIAQAYRAIKGLTSEKLERLRKMTWSGDEATLKRLYDAKPTGELEKLHRFLYLTHFSYGKLRGRSFNPGAKGVTAKTVDRVEACLPRLKGVKVMSGDYEQVVRQYDGPNTAFFLDPPYSGYNVNVGESDFDEERFFEVLKSLKGKWLLTYGVRGKLPKLLKQAGFTIKRIRTPRGIRSMRGVEGPSFLTQIIAANYDFKVEKTAGLEPWNELFFKDTALIKGTHPEDERYVLGVVLEPEKVDAQGDIYSESEVRQAAHTFMEEYGGLGVMHRVRVNDQVKLLESFLAPTELSVGTAKVRKGTWLLAVRILSNELWDKVKSGELTGFSIGGSARSTEVSEERPKSGDKKSAELKKSAPPGKKVEPEAVQRLHDILVEEVSLVDRAANQHRFLIVKRSDEMDETTSAEGVPLPEENQQDGTEQGEEQASDVSETAAEPSRPTDDDLSVAMEALAGLVEAVEALGVVSGDSRPGLVELAERLPPEVIQGDGDDPVAEPGQEEQTPSGKDADGMDAPAAMDGGLLTTTIEAVQSTLARVGELLQEKGRENKAPQTEDDQGALEASNQPEPSKSSNQPEPSKLEQQLGVIANSLETLTQTVQDQQHRMARLEKRFGLPNSQPSGEQQTTEEVGWPLDLNRPCDRESVDKSVSFHEL